MDLKPDEFEDFKPDEFEANCRTWSWSRQPMELAAELRVGADSPWSRLQNLELESTARGAGWRLQGGDDGDVKPLSFAERAMASPEAKSWLVGVMHST